MKNFINKTLIVLIFSLVGFAASAQTMKQRVADRLYDELALFKAVEMYEDLAKKDDASIYILRRTAECYRLLGKYKSSAKWYGKLVEKGGDAVSTDKSDNASNSSSMIPDDYYQYAQMLKMDEKYDLANKMMAKFKSFASGNSVASAHENMPDYVSKIKAMPERYAIAIMNKKVNTEHSDFAPNYWTVDGITKLTFASAKKNMAMLNKDFQWDGSHFLDVYETQLGGDGESTEVKRFDRGIKSKYHEGPVSFSNNGSKMYLTRSNYLNKKKGLDSARHNNLKLYLSEKDSNGEWTELKEFTYNSDDYSLGHATVTEDGKTMYFSSDMPGGKGITDIWKSTNEGGSWSKPVNVAEVNTEGREMFPYLGKTGILYLSSDGQAGLGGLDLYRSTASGETFSTPENMGFPLNTNHDDFAMIVNAEETEGYFSSNRDGDDTFGDDDIYRVKIKEPFGPQLYIVRGCALDAESGAKLAGTTVKLIDTKTDQVFESIVTTEAGCYEFKDVPEGCYKIDGVKPDFTNEYNHSFCTEDAENGVIDPADTKLRKRNCGLLGRIVDQTSGQPIEGATVIMKDKNNGDVQTLTTDANGEFMDPLKGYDCPGGLLDYDVTIAKDGFTPKKVNFTKAITKPGIVEFEERLFKIGGDVKEFCQIEDILYDFNKSYIRPDAAIELDKLVKCMNDNPEMIVEIGSHTDCRASRRYNEKLSSRRAKSAREYVISKGIAAYRIYGRGYGEDRLIEPCPCEPTNRSDCDEDQHQLNRRTEFRIVSGGKNVENNSTNSF